MSGFLYIYILLSTIDNCGTQIIFIYNKEIVLMTQGTSFYNRNIYFKYLYFINRFFWLFTFLRLFILYISGVQNK